jgi:hypothetical protein
MRLASQHNCQHSHSIFLHLDAESGVYYHCTECLLGSRPHKFPSCCSASCVYIILLLESCELLVVGGFERAVREGTP